VLGCDLCEHADAIDYRNRRRDYLETFLDHPVNWEHVAKMLDTAMNKVSHAA
jgi:Fe-Mn family superoxide dismutase